MSNDENPLKGKKILVVDDETTFRQIVAEEFQFEDAETLQAGSGREALALIEKHPIDLVISDIRMPNGDGVELLKAAKSRNPLCPIIMLITGFSDLSPEDAYDSGADALLTKPCDIETILESARRQLIPARKRWSQKSERVAADLEIEFYTDKSDAPVSARLSNIGRGGMFVRCENGQPSVSKTIRFRLALPAHSSDHDPIEGSGVCRWRRLQAEGNLPAGFGVEFLELSEKTIQAVLTIIEKLRPVSYIPKK